MNDDTQTGCLIFGGIVGLILLIAGGCYVTPQYNVYSKKMNGQAMLAEANSTRQTKVVEAAAHRDAAKALAEAEVIRAEGVAKANKIIGESLKNNESYLHYLFINNLEHTKDQIIYIPTEANLPILEAGRKNRVATPAP